MSALLQDDVSSIKAGFVAKRSTRTTSSFIAWHVDLAFYKTPTQSAGKQRNGRPCPTAVLTPGLSAVLAGVI
jgi:hypothetical protein